MIFYDSMSKIFNIYAKFDYLEIKKVQHIKMKHLKYLNKNYIIEYMVLYLYHRKLKFHLNKYLNLHQLTQ